MLHLILDNASARVCALQNIIHVRVIKPAENAADLDILEKAIERGVLQQGACGLLLTMEKFETSPTQEKRQLVVAMMQRLAANLSAVAIVLADEGLKSTITRSVLNTILLTSRVKTTKIFSDMANASAWVVEKMAHKGLALSSLQIAEDAKALIRAPRYNSGALGASARQPLSLA